MVFQNSKFPHRKIPDLPTFFFSSILWWKNPNLFVSFSLSLRPNSSPLHFHLRLILQPELLPMICHISALNKPPHVAGANLFKNPNPYRRKILPVIALKWRWCRSCNSDKYLGTFLFSAALPVQTCASGEPPAQTLHWCAATAASHKNFSWHVSATCVLLLLFKRLFHVGKYIVLSRNLSQVTTQRISENGLPSNSTDFYLTCS